MEFEKARYNIEALNLGIVELKSFYQNSYKESNYRNTFKLSKKQHKSTSYNEIKTLIERINNDGLNDCMRFVMQYLEDYYKDIIFEESKKTLDNDLYEIIFHGVYEIRSILNMYYAGEVLDENGDKYINM